MTKRRATAPYQPHFKEYKPRQHPRLSELDEAQPPMKTLKAIGNGAERKHGYGRGGPC